MLVLSVEIYVAVHRFQRKPVAFVLSLGPSSFLFLFVSFPIFQGHKTYKKQNVVYCALGEIEGVHGIRL